MSAENISDAADESIHSKIAWKIIDKYFKSNTHNLVTHHLDSYNAFVDKDIKRIFSENNPVRFIEPIGDDDEEHKDKDERNQCFMYLGGENADRIYIEKPIIVSGDEDNISKYNYPNYARLHNLTYGVNITYDVEVKYIYYEGGERIEETQWVNDIKLGKIPIMLHSNLCILSGLPREIRYNMGECRNDVGGYFVIDGKEKIVVCQEKFADNTIYVKKHPSDDKHYVFSCEIKCVSEDSSKPIRHTSVRLTHNNGVGVGGDIVVDIPNIRKPVPLFILMRALGVTSDKDIIQLCVGDLDAGKDVAQELMPSIVNNQGIFSQEIAIKYIMTFTKYSKSVSYAMSILMNFFLPHIGEDNYLDKARFIGFMVNRLLRVHMGKDKTTDRDNYTFKRVETSGSMMSDLFREYFILQKKSFATKTSMAYNLHTGEYKREFTTLIEKNITNIFGEKIIETGFKKAFKGNWGSQQATKKIGVLQELNILSWFSKMSHLRKVNLPIGSAGAKIVAPHLLHNSQWGKIDPVDTPDGGNIGFHKHMSITALITSHAPSAPLIEWITKNLSFKPFTTCSSAAQMAEVKLFVNGNWIGTVTEPIQDVALARLCRRNGIIPFQTSISFDFTNGVINFYTDGGRLMRPLFYCTKNTPSYKSNNNNTQITNDKISWTQLITGTGEKTDITFKPKNNMTYTKITDLYNHLGDDSARTKANITFLLKHASVIEYIDTQEEETMLIAKTESQLRGASKQLFTHMEIDPSLIFGIMGNSIVFPEHNQFPRNLFSCGQSRQPASLTHTNFSNRMDTSAIILNNGQIPLVKSKYLKYINNEEHPYGVNVTVAIMSYNGYNVEDAILANEASIKRGLFRTTYLKTYTVREDSGDISGSEVNSVICDIVAKGGGRGDNLNPEYDYSKLDENGLVKEDTPVHEKLIFVGKTTFSSDTPEQWRDSSIHSKKGQSGFIDKVFMTDGKEGTRFAKIRVRDERIPGIGDKLVSRAGQKGTIGVIIPEEDMPFTSEGVRPDLIINPHALPSRMTIGQIIECVLGKTCTQYGGVGDCTAFSSTGSGYDTYNKLLPQVGFHGSGSEILYNGVTGEQLDADIFIGPTYYMRLKHMVKDKINHRGKGPMTLLTRQPVSGKANDGGLKIGEMERDSIMAHGSAHFLNESFLVRGDEYYMAVCNHSGTIAVYNSGKNIFLSPFIDGPLTFFTTDDATKMNVNVCSRHGRSFSIVRIPYALKLLIHELQAINVQMRIITDDNIDQLLNLTYRSNNINKLLHIEEGSDSLNKEVESYVSLMRDKTKTQKNVATHKQPNITTSTKMSKTLKSKRSYLFGDLSGEKIEKIQMDDTAGFSTTDTTQATIMTDILLKHVGGDNNITILDGMACIGGNTRSFAQKFNRVIANELDTYRHDMLVHNMQEVYEFTNINFHKRDINVLVQEIRGKFDILFLDPEWGGPGYKKHDHVLLKIGETPVEQFITDIFDNDTHLSFVGIKLPKNYNREHFVSTVSQHNLGSILYAELAGLKNMDFIVVFRDAPTEEEMHGGGAEPVVHTLAPEPVVRTLAPEPIMPATLMPSILAPMEPAEIDLDDVVIGEEYTTEGGGGDGEVKKITLTIPNESVA